MTIIVFQEEMFNRFTREWPEWLVHHDLTRVGYRILWYWLRFVFVKSQKTPRRLAAERPQSDYNSFVARNDGIRGRFKTQFLLPFVSAKR